MKYKFNILFILILAVLLPHTAWWFEQFEPNTAKWVTWVAAVAFEGAVYAFTEKVAERITAASRIRSFWKRVAKQYVHPYSLGLFIVTAVSIQANRSHAIVFGSSSPVFDVLNMSVQSGSLWAGAVLPVCSLLFAWVLSQESHTEHEVNEDVQRLETKNKELNRELKRMYKLVQTGNEWMTLGSDNKTQRVSTLHKLRPDLNKAELAKFANVSKSLVSTTLSAYGTHRNGAEERV